MRVCCESSPEVDSDDMYSQEVGPFVVPSCWKGLGPMGRRGEFRLETMWKERSSPDWNGM